MPILSSLKFVSAQTKVSVTPAEHRRQKLSTKVLEQLALAKAEQAGTVYAPTQSKRITNDAGEQVTVEKSKKLKAWWWTAANGKINLAVRYGAKVIELAKGKNAVEVADLKQVIETLELINQAVIAGELDAAIEAVANAGKRSC